EIDFRAQRGVGVGLVQRHDDQNRDGEIDEGLAEILKGALEATGQDGQRRPWHIPRTETVRQSLILDRKRGGDDELSQAQNRAPAQHLDFNRTGKDVHCAPPVCPRQYSADRARSLTALSLSRVQTLKSLTNCR